MTTRRKMPVKEFKKLLSKADAISFDGGPILTEWYSDPETVFEVTGVDSDGESWDYLVLEDDADIYTTDSDEGTIFMFYDRYAENSKIFTVKLWKLKPIYRRK